MPEPTCPRCASRRVQAVVPPTQGRAVLLVFLLLPLGVLSIALLTLLPHGPGSAMLYYLLALGVLIMAGSVMLILAGNARGRPGAGARHYRCLDCQARWSAAGATRASVQKIVQELQTPEPDEPPGWMVGLLVPGETSAARQPTAPDENAIRCPHCASQRVRPASSSRDNQLLVLFLMLPLCLLGMAMPTLWEAGGADSGLLSILLSMGSLTLTAVMVMAVLMCAKRGPARRQRGYRCLDCNTRWSTAGGAGAAAPVIGQKQPLEVNQPPANRSARDAGPDADDSWFDQLKR